MIIFFSEDEYAKSQYTLQELTKLNAQFERANLWNKEDLGILQEEVNIDHTITSLSNLKKMVYHQHTITTDDETGILTVTLHESSKEINTFIQDLFRNMKLYDYIINFLEDFDELYIEVRTIDLETLSKHQKSQFTKIRKVFRLCFELMEAFTVKNKKNQGLMWKYKERFSYPHLGNLEHEGELSFV